MLRCVPLVPSVPKVQRVLYRAEALLEMLRLHRFDAFFVNITVFQDPYKELGIIVESKASLPLERNTLFLEHRIRSSKNTTGLSLQ